jgi:CheY-like chemotaxis protein
LTATALTHWLRSDAVANVSAFKPDVLLLDHFIPPLNGLQVLAAVNEAVAAQRLQRPLFIIAMSSQSSKNAAMVAAGADAGFVKWDVPDWPGWARRPEKD